jgi:hypothetical protein
VIPKEGTPGTTAEHEGLHQRSLGLDRVIQIVSGPGGIGDQAVTSHSLIIVREFDLMQGISEPYPPVAFVATAVAMPGAGMEPGFDFSAIYLKK